MRCITTKRSPQRNIFIVSPSSLEKWKLLWSDQLEFASFNTNMLIVDLRFLFFYVKFLHLAVKVVQLCHFLYKKCLYIFDFKKYIFCSLFFDHRLSCFQNTIYFSISLKFAFKKFAFITKYSTSIFNSLSVVILYKLKYFNKLQMHKLYRGRSIMLQNI